MLRAIKASTLWQDRPPARISSIGLLQRLNSSSSFSPSLCFPLQCFPRPLAVSSTRFDPEGFHHPASGSALKRDHRMDVERAQLMVHPPCIERCKFRCRCTRVAAERDQLDDEEQVADGPNREQDYRNEAKDSNCDDVAHVAQASSCW